jgi:quercetin dioxygenase-like cupin family protein
MATASGSQPPPPLALSLDDDQVPYAERWLGVEGIDLKVLVSDVEGGFFVVRVRFAPGIQLPKHLHTGAVHAYTFSGRWSYLEYPDSASSTAGSYLYEPPGSVHTLKVADDNTETTEALFVVGGAMVLYEEDGSVMDVIDAATHKRDYFALLREQGKPLPRIIEGGRAGYGSA